MTRRFTVDALLIACVLALAASPAPAAEDILKLVPDSAFGFLAINQPAAVDAKVQSLARQVQAPVPSPLAVLKQLGMGEALDPKGMAAMLVLPPQGDNPLPTPILLAPVTDYGKFRGQFQPDSTTDAVTKVTLMGKPAWIRNIGGYAALTDASHRAALEKSLRLAKEIPAGLASWQKWLAQNDVALVILAPGVKQLAARGEQAIQRLKESMTNLGGTDKAAAQLKGLAAVFDVYAKILRTAGTQVAAYGLGLQFDKQDVLRVVSRTSLVPGEAWARFLTLVPPAKENLLAGLPAGPFVAAGGGALSEAMTEAMTRWSMDLMKSMRGLYGLSDSQIEKMMTLRRQAMKQCRAFSITLAVGQGHEPIFAGALGALGVDRAKAFMADYEEDFKHNGAFFKSVNSPMLPRLEVAKSEVAGLPALKITTTIPSFPQGPQPPQVARMREAYMGPGDKMLAWLAPADEHQVLFGYVNKEPLQRAIEAIKRGVPGLAHDATVAKTAALLPAGASAVAFLSPAGAIDFVQRIVPELMPPQAKIQWKLPAFGATPPIGFAAVAAPAELRTCLAVPAEVLQAIGQYVRNVRAQGNNSKQ
jgi:hypothetical protein